MKSLIHCLVFLLSITTAHLTAKSKWVDWKETTEASLKGPSELTTKDEQEKDIAIGDVDNDGDDDVVIARKVPFSNPGGQENVLLLNENGVLVVSQKYIPGFQKVDDSRDIALFDANNDKWLDIVVANTFGDQPRLFMNQGLDKKTKRWNGFVEREGWFAPALELPPMFNSVAVGDINGDGWNDLYFSDYDGNLEDRLFVNDGAGFFNDETGARLAAGMADSALSTKAIIDDFNGDGWDDIVKISKGFEPIALRLLLNNGLGIFVDFQDLPFKQVSLIEKADFNNDKRIDLYVVSEGQDYWIINQSTNADGTINVTEFEINGSEKTEGLGGNVHATDLDADGFMDVGVADVNDVAGCDRTFSVLKNMTGFFMTDPNNPENFSWNTNGVHDFGWIDIDQDGNRDMIQGTCSGLRIFSMLSFTGKSAPKPDKYYAYQACFSRRQVN